MNLARRQKALIEKTGKSKDSVEFIQERLKEADELAKKGETIEARKIWSGIVEIYESKREFTTFVEQARERMKPGKRSNSSGEATPGG